MTGSSEPSPASPAVGDAPPTGDPTTSPVNARGKRTHKIERDGVHHTRISGTWAAVVVAVVLGVALVDFIVQNTRSVRIEFFGANGRIPVAVALLAAALAGAVVVLVAGMCRTTQLRLVLRRSKNRANTTPS